MIKDVSSIFNKFSGLMQLNQFKEIIKNGKLVIPESLFKEELQKYLEKKYQIQLKEIELSEQGIRLLAQYESFTVKTLFNIDDFHLTSKSRYVTLLVIQPVDIQSEKVFYKILLGIHEYLLHKIFDMDYIFPEGFEGFRKEGGKVTIDLANIESLNQWLDIKIPIIGETINDMIEIKELHVIDKALEIIIKK